MVPNVRDFLEAKYTVSGAADNRNLCRSTSGIYPFSDFGEACNVRKNHGNQVGHDFRGFKARRVGYILGKNSCKTAEPGVPPARADPLLKLLVCIHILKYLEVVPSINYYRKNSKVGLLKISKMKMKMKIIFESVENFIEIVLEY